MSGSMQVEAAGYKPLTRNLSLEQMSQDHDLYLESVGPAPPAGTTASVDGVTSHPPVAAYVARMDVKRLNMATRHSDFPLR
jgi:hypothetical protein